SICGPAIEWRPIQVAKIEIVLERFLADGAFFHRSLLRFRTRALGGRSTILALPQRTFKYCSKRSGGPVRTEAYERGWRTSFQACPPCLLSVVKGGNQAASGRGGEGRSGLSDLGYFEREAISLNSLVELVQEALRFGGASAEDDRYWLVDLGHTLGFGQSSAQ